MLFLRDIFIFLITTTFIFHAWGYLFVSLIYFHLLVNSISSYPFFVKCHIVSSMGGKYVTQLAGFAESELSVKL